jgi:TRAP-type mannitol/chloroaromatic compound transport system permease large subunit
MSPFLIGLVGLVFVLLFLALRVPVGISLAIVSVGGIAYLKGLNAAMGALESVPFDFTAHWTLSSIPMFLLMGSIASGAGMTTNLFAAMRQWLSWLPGGLAVTTTFTGAGFAAASGSSLATTATLGRTAVPEMIRFGY